jgi:hypothetical protein
MLSFLGLNLDQWVGVAVLTQTALAGAGADFVRRQLKQARDAQAELTRPYVIVDLQHKAGVLDVVVENIGQSPAFDLRVTFQPELAVPASATDDDRHQVDGFVTRLAGDGISFMPPRQVHRFRYALAHVVKDGGYTTDTTASVSYCRTPGGANRYAESFRIDLGGVWHASLERTVEESVRSISKSMSAVASALRS